MFSRKRSLNGKPIAQAMIDGGFVDEPGFYRVIADALGTEFVDLGEHEIPPADSTIDSRRSRSTASCSAGRVLPITLCSRARRSVRPRASRKIFALRLGKDIHVVVSPTEQIEDRIKRYYGTDTSSMEDILKQLGEAGELMTLRGDDGSAADVEAEANATPIIRFVDLILFQAIQDRASDIHFEPFENEFKIRYRVDGALYEMAPPPRHLALPVISRVKVMANMNIAERRLAAGWPHPKKHRGPHCRYARVNFAHAIWRERCPACARSFAPSISISRRSACPITSMITFSM